MDINPSKARRLDTCATSLTFVVGADGRKRLSRADFCRVRLCPMCQWRRSLKLYGQMQRIIEGIAQRSERCRYLFCTLTVPSCTGSDLSATIDGLMDGWHRYWRTLQSLAGALGYYRGLEVTHNLTDNTYHPHFHVVLCVDSAYFGDRLLYKTQGWYSTEWQRAIRSERQLIVDVRAFRGTSAGLAEACKYSCKSSDYIILDDWDMTLETVAILDSALANRRLASFGGLLKVVHRELNLDDNEDGDLIHLDDTAVEDNSYEITYNWYVGYRQYRLA